MYIPSVYSIILLVKNFTATKVKDAAMFYLAKRYCTLTRLMYVFAKTDILLSDVQS